MLFKMQSEDDGKKGVVTGKIEVEGLKPSFQFDYKIEFTAKDHQTPSTLDIAIAFLEGAREAVRHLPDGKRDKLEPIAKDIDELKDRVIDELKWLTTKGERK